MKKEIIATFPHMANYYVAFEKVFTKGFGLKTIVPPPITRKTLELGSKHSPDFVCSPFKYNLGNFIEALELGANVLFQAGGACRYGYYAELQETILKDLGYDFKLLQFPREKKEIFTFLSEMKKTGIKINYFKVIYYLTLCIKMIKYIDVFEDYIRKNIGFEIQDGSFAKLQTEFLNILSNTNSIRKLKLIFKDYMEKLENIQINKPDKTIKVGIVGELYTIMDSFSNHYIEKELGKKGVEITRFVTLDYLIFEHAQSEKKLLKITNDYVKHHLGAGGTDSVVKSLAFAEEKYDGIIHLKAFGCTPEVNAMPILQKLSNDLKIPIIHFSFDTATSETGVKTRLEAFYDMLVMRREKL